MSIHLHYILSIAESAEIGAALRLAMVPPRRETDSNALTLADSLLQVDSFAGTGTGTGAGAGRSRPRSLPPEAPEPPDRSQPRRSR